MDEVDSTMLPGGNVPSHWYDTMDRQSSQIISNAAKGLRNAPGENNCFLNSAVQVFWHIDVFRRSYRRLSGHVCMGHSCIFCALKVIFTQFQYSDQSSLQPNALRKAMASTFAKQERFQLGHMDDAAECFENILHRIHYHVASTYNEDTCNAPHCIPHQKFAMTVCDQLVCPCGASNEPHKFHEMVHYISANALVAQSRTMQETGDVIHPDRFGLLLRNAGAVGNVRDCPGNCGKRIQIRRTLLNVPDVVSVGLVWGSDRPDMELTTEVARAIGTGLLLPDIFHSVMCSKNQQLPRLQLSAMVCYYGKHYSTFVWHTKLGMWIYFDDATVKEIGTRWEDVVSKCVQSRYQPLLLIYTNLNAVPVSTETAPCTRVMAPGYSMTPAKEEKNSTELPQEPEKPPGKARRSLTPSLDSTDGNQTNNKQTGSTSKSSGEKELGRKSSFEHRRQSSFLIAVKANAQKENHYQVPHNNRGIQSQAGNRIMEQIEGRNSVKSPVNELDMDNYNYTLSTSDQYRRPVLTNQDSANLPLSVNFSRTNETRKESFKKGRQNIPADVVRYHMDPSRRPSQSSDSDQSSPPCVERSEPESVTQHHHHGKHMRTRSQSLEDNLGNISDTGGSANPHNVVKPKPSSASMYENDCVTRAHTPVQSGLATLPRKKKSDNVHSPTSHNSTTPGSQHNDISHMHQNSQTMSANLQYSNYPAPSHPHDDTNYQKYQNALTYQNVVDTDLHSRQSSTSSILSSGTVVECPVGNLTDAALHNRQSSSVSQDTLTGMETKEKPEKSKESKSKTKRKDDKRVKTKKEKRHSSGKPPPGPDKQDKKQKDEGFAEDNSYIDRKMVESVLSFQKLQRSGSCVSQASTSSIESESNIKCHGIVPKDNLSSEIPFDTTSLDSHKDSGYGSSDRNSSSSTGSITMNPYEQYFLSRSMIPPKTFNHQVMAENMRKLMDQGTGPAGLGYTQEKDLKSIVVNPNEQYNQNITVGHCQTGNYPSHFTQIAEVPPQSSTPRDVMSLPKEVRNQQILDPLNKRGPKPVPPPKVGSVGSKGHPQAVLPNKQSIGQKPSYPGPNGGNPVVQNWNNLQTNNDVTTSQETNIQQQLIDDGNQQQHGNGSNEALHCGNGDFLALCEKSEDIMDECVLAETSERYGDALRLCQSAIDQLKAAMRFPSISQSSHTYAQRKSNSCILKLRSLQKRLMLRQESNTSTNSSDSGHHDHRNQKAHPPSRSQQAVSIPNIAVRPPSRSSSLNSMDSARDGSITSTCSSGRSDTPVLEGNKPLSRPPVDSRVPPPEYHNTYNNNNKDRSFETNIPDGTNADLYGTLPRRKTQKSQEHSTNNQQHEKEVYQDFLDNQRRQNDNHQNLNQQNMSHNTNLTQQNVLHQNLTKNVSHNQNLTRTNVSHLTNLTQQNVPRNQNFTQNQPLSGARIPEKSPFAAGPSVRNHLKMHSVKPGLAQVRQLTQSGAGTVSANEQRSQYMAPHPTMPPLKQQTSQHPPEVGTTDTRKGTTLPGNQHGIVHGNHSNRHSNKARYGTVVGTVSTAMSSAIQSAYMSTVSPIAAGSDDKVTTEAGNHISAPSKALVARQQGGTGRRLDRSSSFSHSTPPAYSQLFPDSSANEADRLPTKGDLVSSARHGASQPELRNIHVVESMNNPIRPITPVVPNPDDSTDAESPVVSVKDLASRFETSTGISKTDPQTCDSSVNSHSVLSPVSSAPIDNGLNTARRVAIQRQRSKSESEFLDTKPTKPKSVLAKKSKKGNSTRKPRKSVTFSANVCLVEAANQWGLVPSDEHGTEAGYQSDEEGRIRASKNIAANDDDSSSTDSPVEIFGDAACILCHKKGVVSGQNYCEKCTFYMSRFTPIANSNSR